ncbi:MAG: hypothetical protein LKJ88_05735 [Bacilli bacterium]|jgi:hypothetical protein|nr:hypothetical protein [Bacilli bacterium]
MNDITYLTKSIISKEEYSSIISGIDGAHLEDNGNGQLWIDLDGKKGTQMIITLVTIKDGIIDFGFNPKLSYRASELPFEKPVFNIAQYRNSALASIVIRALGEKHPELKYMSDYMEKFEPVSKKLKL